MSVYAKCFGTVTQSKIHNASSEYSSGMWVYTSYWSEWENPSGQCWIYGSETTTSSWNVNVYKSNDGSTWTYVDYLSSGGTVYISLYTSGDTYIKIGSDSTPTYSTNLMYFRTGAGISSYTVRYANSTSTGITQTASSSTSSASACVRRGTNASLYSYTISDTDNYCYPLTFTSYDSTWTTGTDFTEGDYNVYSSTSAQTRYIKLKARQKKTLTFSMGGVWTLSFTNGDSISQTATSRAATYKAGVDIIISPTLIFHRDYPNFTGKVYWGLSLNAKTYLISTWKNGIRQSDGDGSESARTISYTSSDRTIYITVDGVSGHEVYLDPNGGKVNGYTSKYFVGTIQHESALVLPTISQCSRSGYTINGFRYNSTTGKLYNPGTSVTITEGCLFYADWKKKAVTKFWWDAAEGNDDPIIINPGLACSKLTGANWTRFKQKIEELSKLEDKTYTATTTSSGEPITADEFNTARNAIASLDSPGALPENVTKNITTIKASLFRTINGSAALRDALNTAIDNFNNS